MMTRKHYEAFAARIKRKLDSGISQNELELVAQVFIEVASEDNPRFNRDTFLKACGL